MFRQIVSLGLAITASVAACACGSQGPTQPSVVRSAPVSPGSTMSTGAHTTAAHNSEQLVFSGKSDDGSVGFWIWCEVDSQNSYANECNGTMYFYAFGLTKHVEDVENGISEGPNDTYQIMVHSTLDTSVACTLHNTAEPQKGPNNNVAVVCTSPSVSGASSNAVVNVTGPGD